MCAATEKPSRMYIPEEYVRTGRSMKRSSSAKATISSIDSRMRARERPWIDPFRYTFSRPVKSGWKPAPSSSSEPMRPPTATRPEDRLEDPGEETQQGRLARAVAPDEPERLPGVGAQRDVAQRPDLRVAERGLARRRGP